MKNYTFLNPEFFWLLLVLPVVLFWLFYSNKKQLATLKIGSLASLENTSTFLSKTKPYLTVLRVIALAFLIIALARPRTSSVTNKIITTNGIEIVMAIDVSGSMLAQDLKPNRLEALKRVATKFVNDRKSDRIGIVLYAGESYTKTPVTSDKLMLAQAIENIQFDNTLLEDGTGIGQGLATAINRLKDSKTKSRIIILLTDGVNNAGTIDPRMAATIAKQYGIKVYTIGIGTNGMALMPIGRDFTGKIVYQNMQVQIDESLMKEIAKTTNGKYFRATSNQKLKEVYEEINKLETSKLNENKYFNYEEKYTLFAWIAFILLILELGLRKTIYKSFV